MSKQNKLLWIIVIVIIIFLVNYKAKQQMIVGTGLSGYTTVNDGHRHSFSVDVDGNGFTSFNNNHEHAIYQYTVWEEDNHIHTLAR